MPTAAGEDSHVPGVWQVIPPARPAETTHAQALGPGQSAPRVSSVRQEVLGPDTSARPPAASQRRAPVSVLGVRPQVPTAQRAREARATSLGRGGRAMRRLRTRGHQPQETYADSHGRQAACVRPVWESLPSPRTPPSPLLSRAQSRVAADTPEVSGLSSGQLFTY